MEARYVIGDVIDQETIKHPWKQTAPASVVFSKRSLWFCPCLFIVVCQAQYISLSIIMASKQDYRRCVVPCPRYITGGDTHQLFVAVWEWSMPTVSSRGSWLWALREAVREDAPLPPGVLRGGRFGSRSPRGSLCCRGTETARISGFANGSDSGGWDGLRPFSAFTCQI
jgi:hypothetical protein